MNTRSPVSDLLSLEGRVAVVAGGGGGIGRAVVGRLLEARAKVFSVDQAGVGAEAGAESLECDLADPGAFEALFEDLRARAGRLDVVVHAAGVTADGVVWKLDDEAWTRVLAVNLDSAFRVIRGAVPWLRETGGGSVILVSSINGERGKFGQANYAASKAGLVGLARTAARETGRFGIRVNVVAPGLIETRMTESLPAEVKQQAVDESALGRAGQPDDVARAVLFLATDASRHVTGQTLRVDGGQLIG